LLTFEFSPNIENDAFVNEGYSSLIILEINTLPKETDNKYAIHKLHQNVQIYNKIKANDIHYFELAKNNRDDNFIILEMSLCSNDIEYRVIKSLEDTKTKYKDLDKLEQNGRHITFITDIKTTNYLEVKGGHSASEYSIRYVSKNEHYLIKNVAGNQGMSYN
jgi:hypothetical protein